MPNKRVIQFLRLFSSDEPESVAVDNPLPVEIINPRESNGAIPVNIQDQHTEIIDLYLTQLLDTCSLDIAVAIGGTTARITTTGATPVTGNILSLKEGTAFYQAEILTARRVFMLTSPPVAGNPVADNQYDLTYDLTLDTPLDFDFTTGAICNLGNQNAQVDGSATPKIFSVSPVGLVAGIAWDITRIIILITDNVVMDDAKFGGITALPKGIVLRKKDILYKNIFNAKTNGELALRCYDTAYSDKAPAGFYGFRARRTFAGQEKNGVTIRLNADDNDELQLIIQDDLTGLTKVNIIAQGHVIEN
jgi:hypothetical protein